MADPSQTALLKSAIAPAGSADLHSDPSAGSLAGIARIARPAKRFSALAAAPMLLGSLLGCSESSGTELSGGSAVDVSASEQGTANAELASAQAAELEAIQAGTPEERLAARQELSELVDVMVSPDPVWTSDIQEEWIRDQRRRQTALVNREAWVGAEALELLQASREAIPAAKTALLEIATRCAPHHCKDALLHWVQTYRPGDEMLRTDAARLLAQHLPHEAEPLLRELLSGPIGVTLPPGELLVRYYTDAAVQLSVEDPVLLSNLAIEIKRSPEVRYAAIECLGKFKTPRAIGALRVLLVESGPDGHLRRKAARALAENMETEELCNLLAEVADKESDQAFLAFLADFLDRNCS